MTPPIKTIKVKSLKEACVARMEELILSGELQAGERLPAERDLALKLGVSRPVLHEALVDLSSKGLVSIIPRRGVLINDFRREGSFAILSSLLNYNNGQLDPKFTQSLLAMRILVETETARLAAHNASEEQITELRSILAMENAISRDDVARLTELDFDFHLQISVASENVAYPLILNSFKNVYTHFTSSFFHLFAGTSVIEEVLKFQQYLVDAIASRKPKRASEIMVSMLMHGESYLKKGN
jgi:GntR family transcriptional repressor for pyruvate dehydrogenase complex